MDLPVMQPIIFSGLENKDLLRLGRFCFNVTEVDSRDLPSLKRIVSILDKCPHLHSIEIFLNFREPMNTEKRRLLLAIREHFSRLRNLKFFHINIEEWLGIGKIPSKEISIVDEKVGAVRDEIIKKVTKRRGA